MNRQERRILRAKFGRLSIVRGDDGALMEVIRPENPTMALTIAKLAVEKNDSVLFDRLPEEVGHYTFVGYLAKHGDNIYVVDEAGDIIDSVNPGDSFVTPRKDVS